MINSAKLETYVAKKKKKKTVWKHVISWRGERGDVVEIQSFRCQSTKDTYILISINFFSPKEINRKRKASLVTYSNS